MTGPGLFDRPAPSGGARPPKKPWRVSYWEDPDARISANLIRSWERGEIEEPVMSTSSGPKDYLRNRVWTIFDGCPDVARVLLLRGEYSRSIPFLLVMNETGRVCDMAGKEVVIEL